MVIKVKKSHIFVLVVLFLFSVGTAEFSSYLVSAAPQKSLEPLPIVMYHQISKRASKAGKYCVTIAELENDLKHIKECGYTAINMTQLINAVYNGTQLPEKPIIITFDDGYETANEYLLPLLEKYDMKAVVSIIGSVTDLYEEANDHNLSYSYLNWTQVKQLAAGDRIEIQNHSYDLHRNTETRRGAKKTSGESTEAYAGILVADIGKMQELVSEKAGTVPNTFAYPFGQYSRESKDVLKQLGFKAALVCEERVKRIDFESTDWLFRLGRFNRAHGKSSEEFFSKLFAD